MQKISSLQQELDEKESVRAPFRASSLFLPAKSANNPG
jgi:hypothetical protein